MDTKKLRQKILDLAIRGKLVPQDPNDEPASVLLERIRAEKQQLIKEGKIKASKGSKACDTSHYEKIDGPFEIPESWEWCKINDIGEVITGNTPPKSQKNYFGGPIPFFKPTDLEQGFKTTKSSDSLTIDGYKVSRQLPKNSILVTCIGATIGKTGIIRNEGSCNQQINAIVPATIINPEYIYFLCISNYFQKAVKTSASATTLPILNKNSFAKLLLPLPPEKEQNEIVQTIQKWLSYVENIENSIIGVKKDAEVTKSKILSLAISGKLIPQDPSDEPAIELLRRINPDFKPCDNSHYENLPEGWVECKMSDICKVVMGQSPDGKTISQTEGVEFHQGKIAFGETYLANSGVYTSAPTKITEAHSIVLCVRAPVGIPNITERKICIGRGLCAISCSPVIEVKFLFYCIQTMRRYFENLSTGSTFNAISGDVVKNTVISVPPLQEQHRIVAKIEECLKYLKRIGDFLN